MLKSGASGIVFAKRTPVDAGVNCSNSGATVAAIAAASVALGVGASVAPLHAPATTISAAMALREACLTAQRCALSDVSRSSPVRAHPLFVLAPAPA